MIISTNIIAIDVYKTLKKEEKVKDNLVSQIATGFKVKSARDDASGLSISEKMKSQIRGLAKASTNTENAISMVQIAEGALKETNAALLRMKTLSVESANGSLSDEDREGLQEELEQLTNEINRIGDTTEFNGISLLNGLKVDSRRYDSSTGILIDGADNSVHYQVGANPNETINVEFNDMTAVAVGIATKELGNSETGETTTETNGETLTAHFAKTKNVINAITKDLAAHSLDISTRRGAEESMPIIDEAIKKVASERGKYGAIENRLEHTANSIDVSYENMIAAESRIVDSDIAEATMKMAKSSILIQSAQSMLTFANMRQENALGLLKDDTKTTSNVVEFKKPDPIVMKKDDK
ncbi:MAG: flagellin [Clostridia bacterium]|nr:flagellin [Clostridia bacterium]